MSFVSNVQKEHFIFYSWPISLSRFRPSQKKRKQESFYCSSRKDFCCNRANPSNWNRVPHVFPLIIIKEAVLNFKSKIAERKTFRDGFFTNSNRMSGTLSANKSFLGRAINKGIHFCRRVDFSRLEVVKSFRKPPRQKKSEKTILQRNNNEMS